MSSSVVTKVEGRLIGNGNFTDLDVVPYSGNISQVWKNSFDGVIADVSVSFKKEKWSAENESMMKGLRLRKAQFRITDADGAVRLVGTDDVPARLSYQSVVPPTAGSFNGFECSIKWQSVEGVGNG